MATQPQQDSHQAQHELLIATTDPDQRAFLAAQLDADGHTVYEADSPQAAIARLSAHAIDVMILGRLHRAADGPALLRAIRAGEHPRIHPGQPVITLGADYELDVLRAYEAGSDHHLPDTTGYLLLCAVLTSVLRRTVETVTSRHLHVADMHIDLAARTVDIAGTVVRPSPLEFELLVVFASDPVRVFSRDDLARSVWHSVHVSARTVDSHVCHLRNRLTNAGAHGVLVNRWGHGWALTTPH
ncbi:MAG: response regulator transcription factor [Solirubrobacteraceae bacterium]